MNPDVVPLPEHLDGCGCDGPRDLHRTNCEAAIAYDDSDKHYEPGKRYQGIRWQYPVSVEMPDVRFRASIDLEAYLRGRLNEYIRFVLPDGHFAWERPAVFLHDQVEERFSGMDLPGAFRVLWDSSSLGNLELRTTPRPGAGSKKWTKADTDRLHQSLGITVDDDGNLVPPPTVEEQMADVFNQLLPKAFPQPSPEARLLADLLGDDGSEDRINTMTDAALAAHAAEVRRLDAAAKVRFLIDRFGGVAAAREAMLPAPHDRES